MRALHSSNLTPNAERWMENRLHNTRAGFLVLHVIAVTSQREDESHFNRPSRNVLYVKLYLAKYFRRQSEQMARDGGDGGDEKSNGKTGIYLTRRNDI